MSFVTDDYILQNGRMEMIVIIFKVFKVIFYITYMVVYNFQCLHDIFTMSLKRCYYFDF